MLPKDVKALREDLGVSAKQLAEALGTDQKTIFAWETGELFPTKRHVQLMQKLKRTGALTMPPRAQPQPNTRAPAPPAIGPPNVNSGGEDTLASLESAPPLPGGGEQAKTRDRLTDPKLWAIIKKLVDDEDFFYDVARLADKPPQR